MRNILIGLVAVAALSASASAATVSVSDGWFRSLPGNLPAAGYFVLKNSGTAPVALTSASSPACASLMLHMTHNMNGMMHMMEVTKVDAPAGGTVKFASGGLHLMCMEPKLKVGSNVPVSLKFSDGSEIKADFAVRPATGK
jgi:copper(I)-binding protein